MISTPSIEIERPRAEIPASRQPAEAEPFEQTELALVFAHEIRNLLSPLSNCSQLLLAPDLDARARQRIGEVIGRQVRQLQRLTNDLLDAYRLHQQQLALQRRTVDLNAALAVICEDHRPAFSAAGIDLVVRGTSAPLLLSIDLDRIAQVVNNLLSNSLKFTDRGGKVSVSLFVDGVRRAAVIAVRDTGMGIDAAVLDTIMTPGMHDLSGRNHSGLGLGLPLAKRLVELHQGELSASSDGLGQGSDFRIYLPLAVS
jgi:signal transduction histidine kinase